MGEKSHIEWTDATWNPWHGCHKVSQGCKNCYMFRDKVRYGQDPNVVVRSKTKFYDPLTWHEPRTIFTCSWSDFFIEEADEWRDEAFEVIAKTPQHTYQILTKRPDRMLDYISRSAYLTNAPLENVWLGVSVEDQKTADERIPLLLQTPAAIRFLSIEPMLGPIRLSSVPGLNKLPVVHRLEGRGQAGVDWIICGGESGPDARPMHPQWARDIRDQCVEAKVPYFFKQFGEYTGVLDAETYRTIGAPDFWMSEDGRRLSEEDAVADGGSFKGMYRLGKKKAGRELDGRTWDEMPEVSR